MPSHFTGVSSDIEVKIGGKARYRVLALVWDEDTNLLRYLINGKERPVWIPETDVTAVFPEPYND
ncbi:hypothetical protein [Paractinoplanes atraurantiacus]|uniref:Uncharacterized protein n=1 Tax=Paractinoplanes atraurantiacus TaxID=1036182 RepID=A0A285IZT1_9ACTN|nr:hypothetical protein [Actinoplanes atraurantiacus]SNY53570.1 hypothetical protein SAMN05421748_11466 [Actinoplanes atraurantiacus]